MANKTIPGCKGWTLWKGKRLRLELWVCRQSVAAHRHPGQRVQVMPLWGRAGFWRQATRVSRAQRVSVGPGYWGRSLTIPAGWWHGFDLRRGPLVFVNATFDGKSAAENFAT